MEAKYHTLAGGIASAALVPELGVYSAAFFASSVLIDFDHYLDYVYHNGFTDFSVRRMFAYCDALEKESKGRSFVALSIMHTVEFILLVYAVAYATGLVFMEAILWGLLFHLALDLVYLGSQRRLLDRAFSLVEFFIRWNRMKRRGLRPELPYRLALEAVLPESGLAGHGQEEEAAHEDEEAADQKD